MFSALRHGKIMSRTHGCYSTRAPLTPEFRLKARLQHLYDMSIDQYAAMLKAQNGECAICKTALGSKPNVDHCHVSRKVRGLLCSRCNSWLAAIEHPTFPLRALEYLGRFT